MKTPHPSATGDNTGRHVLIMDDTQEILDLLQELLLEEGYRVTSFQEMLDLDAIKAINPDIIVQDLLFAGTQEVGWKLLTLIRLDPELVHIPVVLCTAATDVVHDEEMAENLQNLGVRVILKPFALDELLSVLQESFTPQTDESVSTR